MKPAASQRNVVPPAPAVSPFRGVYLALGCVTLAAWLICSVMSLRSGRTVTPAYHEAAIAWFNGENLYKSTGHGFLYLPHAAILFAPFAALPMPIGEPLWRLLNVAVFAWGVARFARLLPDLKPRTLVLISAVCLLIAVNCLRSGQATLLMTGLMILAAEALASRTWQRAATFIVLAVAVKPLAIVMALLAFALYGPIRRPLAIGAVLTALVPFATHHPDYVANQYRGFAAMLTHANRLSVEELWFQLFGMLHVIGVTFAPHVETLIRLGAALATLGLCFVAVRKCEARRAAAYLFAFTAVYLMLFNPRTENNTYCVVAPALALFLAIETSARHRLRAALIGVLTVGIAGAFEIGKTLAPNVRPVWIAPLCCCLFAVYLLRELLRDATTDRGAKPTTSPVVNLPPRRAA